MAKRYGIGYRDLRVECIIDSDGSAKIIRRVIVDAYSKLSTLDTFLLIPESRYGAPAWDLRVQDADSVNSKRTVQAEERAIEPGKLSLLLTISPELNAGEALEYRLTETISAGLFAIGLTPEQLTQRLSPLDYFGWHINRPTKRLEMRVIFPPGHALPSTFDHEVRYASASALPSVRRQDEEYKRIGAPYPGEANDGRKTLELVVDYPMAGLIYMMSWKPTPRTS